MKCQDCRTRLMNLDDPTGPPPQVAEHLAVCVRCQDWQRRLLRLEEGVSALPSPSTQAKARLVEFFLHPPTQRGPDDSAQKCPETAGTAVPPVQGDSSVPTIPLTPGQGWVRSRRWLRPLLAMAAGLLLAVLGLWLGQRIFQKNDAPPLVEHKNPEPPKILGPKDKEVLPEKKSPDRSLAALVVEYDLQLAETANPQRRVALLADLADVLGKESMWLAHAEGVKELAFMTQLYDKVISKGVVARARALPMEERRDALDPLVQRLHARGKAAEQLANKAPMPVAEPLRQLAAAARRGSEQLKLLMDEATP